MSISILVEPATNGYRAITGGPLDLVAEAATASAAVAAVQAKIAARLQSGARIVELPVPPKSPIPELPLAENPLLDQFLAAVEEYRNQRDAEDQALYQDGP